MHREAQRRYRLNAALNVTVTRFCSHYKDSHTQPGRNEIMLDDQTLEWLSQMPDPRKMCILVQQLAYLLQYDATGSRIREVEALLLQEFN